MYLKNEPSHHTTLRWVATNQLGLFHDLIYLTPIPNIISFNNHILRQLMEVCAHPPAGSIQLHMGDQTTYTLVGQLTPCEHCDMAIWGITTSLLASLLKVFFINVIPEYLIVGSDGQPDIFISNDAKFENHWTMHLQP